MKNSIFGTRMRQARNDKGWTQQNLVVKTGLTQNNISRYERGLIEPSLFTAILISDALCVSLDWMTGREEK